MQTISEGLFLLLVSVSSLYHFSVIQHRFGVIIQTLRGPDVAENAHVLSQSISEVGWLAATLILKADCKYMCFLNPDLIHCWLSPLLLWDHLSASLGLRSSFPLSLPFSRKEQENVLRLLL